MADEERLPLPRGPEELRAAFGDRKLPDISRKITACVSCRKLKVNSLHFHPPPILPLCLCLRIYWEAKGLPYRAR